MQSIQLQILLHELMANKIVLLSYTGMQRILLGFQPEKRMQMHGVQIPNSF